MSSTLGSNLTMMLQAQAKAGGTASLRQAGGSAAVRPLLSPASTRRLHQSCQQPHSQQHSQPRHGQTVPSAMSIPLSSGSSSQNSSLGVWSGQHCRVLLHPSLSLQMYLFTMRCIWQNPGAAALPTGNKTVANLRAICFFVTSMTLAIPLFLSMALMHPFVMCLDRNRYSTGGQGIVSMYANAAPNL